MSETPETAPKNTGNKRHIHPSPNATNPSISTSRKVRNERNLHSSKPVQHTRIVKSASFHTTNGLEWNGLDLGKTHAVEAAKTSTRLAFANRPSINENPILYKMMITSRQTIWSTRYSTSIELAGITDEVIVLVTLVARIIFSSS
jgi:hypothetical protein